MYNCSCTLFVQLCDVDQLKNKEAIKNPALYAPPPPPDYQSSFNSDEKSITINLYIVVMSGFPFTFCALPSYVDQKALISVKREI
jgi:hypothetical protein